VRRSLSRNQGSILIWTVLTIAILSVIVAEAVRVVSIKYQSSLQSTQWQAALLGAESGVDLAIVELRKSLYPPSLYANVTPFPTASPAGSWDGPPTADGSTGGHETITIPSAGLAGTNVTIDVKVDKPTTILATTAPYYQYYRIRSTGTLPITGPARATDNKYDSNLRKLSLQWERFATGLASHLSTPQVSRRIEVVVKPVSSFNLAALSMGQLDLTSGNIVIDSYDSRDGTKSTNQLYDVAKRQQNGDIATDGNLINAGNAHIYGDVYTNSGTVTGTAGITGQQRTDFYQDAISVAAPSGFPATATTINNGTTLTVSGAPVGNGAQGSPARYTVSSVDLNGNGNLIIGDANTTGYIEVYVTGSVSVTGSSQITLSPNVKATIYFAGDFSVSGSGIVNSNNQPGDLQLYGIKPANNVTQSVSLGGNAELSAALYAPDANVTINGGGSNGHVYGSIVGKTVVMNGVTNLHYDEALGASGLIDNYKIVSWFEDNR
jgi:hypothetical protein